MSAVSFQSPSVPTDVNDSLAASYVEVSPAEVSPTNSSSPQSIEGEWIEVPNETLDLDIIPLETRRALYRLMAAVNKEIVERMEREGGISDLSAVFTLIEGRQKEFSDLLKGVLPPPSSKWPPLMIPLTVDTLKLFRMTYDAKNSLQHRLVPQEGQGVIFLPHTPPTSRDSSAPPTPCQLMAGDIVQRMKTVLEEGNKLSALEKERLEALLEEESERKVRGPVSPLHLPSSKVEAATAPRASDGSRSIIVMASSVPCPQPPISQIATAALAPINTLSPPPLASESQAATITTGPLDPPPTSVVAAVPAQTLAATVPVPAPLPAATGARQQRVVTPVKMCPFNSNNCILNFFNSLFSSR